MTATPEGNAEGLVSLARARRRASALIDSMPRGRTVDPSPRPRGYGRPPAPPPPGRFEGRFADADVVEDDPSPVPLVPPRHRGTPQRLQRPRPPSSEPLRGAPARPGPSARPGASS